MYSFKKNKYIFTYIKYVLSKRIAKIVECLTVFNYDVR